ncbi:hypothetical protein JXB02_04445 [Candidatus Woesearchaeota archaeon]|nr:hypothetical protein [Candidatus Woesearchaeota archaeon]
MGRKIDLRPGWREKSREREAVNRVLLHLHTDKDALHLGSFTAKADLGRIVDSLIRNFGHREYRLDLGNIQYKDSPEAQRTRVKYTLAPLVEFTPKPVLHPFLPSFFYALGQYILTLENSVDASEREGKRDALYPAREARLRDLIRERRVRLMTLIPEYDTKTQHDAEYRLVVDYLARGIRNQVFWANKHHHHSLEKGWDYPFVRKLSKANFPRVLDEARELMGLNGEMLYPLDERRVVRYLLYFQRDAPAIYGLLFQASKADLTLPAGAADRRG